MNLLKDDLVATIQARFFQVLDIELPYDELLTEMLQVIKNHFHLAEVTYYSCMKWKEELYLESSTSLERLSDKSNKVILVAAAEEDPVVLWPIQQAFSAYDVLVWLENSSQKYGLLAIKTNERLIAAQKNVYLELAPLFTGFIEKIHKIRKTKTEEQRYKQLFRINEKFHSTMDMDEVLREIIYTLQDMYPSFEHYLMLTHDNSHLQDLPVKDLEYDSDNLAAMQAYVTGEVQLDDSKLTGHSILYAPVKGKQGVYGVLQVIASNAPVFPEGEVEFIRLLANTAGSALENAQLYQQSKRLVADLQLINETSHRLNSNLRLADMLKFMTNQIMCSFEAEQVCFFQVSEDLVTVNLLSGSTEYFNQPQSMEYIQYTLDKFKGDRDALFIGDVRLPDTVDGPYKALMAVPMIQSGVLKGAAVVLHSSPYYFSFETFKLLQSLVYHSTLAFTNSMLREELEKMVVTDHLTKLFSRSYLDKKVHESLLKDPQGTFLLIDIDNFKGVNDQYGHQIGDDILVQVANIIKINIRDSDIGARWGGEELAVYLPKVTVELGQAIATRLVEKVRSSSNPTVTISCGVAYWSADCADTFQRLFKRADEALYEAKGTGKNKVVYHEKELY